MEQGPTRPHALPASARIRRRPEFLRVYEQGVRIRARLMTVIALPNALGRSRLGIAATRKLGGAVVRPGVYRETANATNGLVITRSRHGLPDGVDQVVSFVVDEPVGARDEKDTRND